MTMGERAKKRRLGLGLNQVEVAKIIGVYKSAVSQWESGNEVTIANLNRWANALQTTTSFLLSGDGPEFLESSEFSIDHTFLEKNKQVPVISWVQAGAWMEIEDNFHPGDADEWVKPPFNVGERSFALRILGDSMEPKFYPGDIIIVDPDVPVETGKFVIAKIKNGNPGEDEATFKQFFRDGDRVLLKPLNRDDYKVMDVTDKDVCIVGVMVQRITKF